MVINNNPCYIYNLSSNTLVDHVTVIAHATAHNDFFKNNRMFQPTSQNMMNELANHGTRIRRYESEWGKQQVQMFIDQVLSLQTLIDPASAYIKREYEEPLIWGKRNYIEPRRIQIPENQKYLEEWVNNKELKEKEEARIKKIEAMQEIGAMQTPERDIFRFLRDNAPLKQWQKDIISMIYEEELYFSPQGATKMINEGWASFADSQIMARYGLANGDGIYEYALHKAGVLGGPNSMNPYKLGYQLFLDIEERWNKGRFGFEYDECRDYGKKMAWNTNAGLGHEKIFEVRALYNDIEMLQEFFTEDFCHENNFYEKRRMPDGSWEIVSRDFKKIKNLLVRSKINRGLPDVRIVDTDYKHRNILVLRHIFDGRIFNDHISSGALQSIAKIWNHPVVLLTKDKKEQEYCLYIDEKGEAIKTDFSKI
jgi:stage V sporulation protein R